MNNKKLLVIGFTWPEPTTTAAGNRMLQLLYFFLSQEYQITFSSTASESSQSLDLEELGIEKVPIQLNDAGFDTLIKELQPEVVLFDRFLTEEQFGWRIAEHAPGAMRILDTEDLHSLRKAREKAFKSNVAFTKAYWLTTDLCKRELASIFRSDLSLIISSYEMNLLIESVQMDDAILLHLPFMLESLEKEVITSWKPFEERKDFVCIGNGKHAPNVDALLWLKKEIWPLIRKQLPEAELHVYGAYLPNQILQMHNQKEGFLIHGWVADLNSAMQSARVNLAPLRFGAGLKGKLIAAMQNGTPSVTTVIGTEGMHDGLEFSGFISDDPKVFADKAVALYSGMNTWEAAQNKGIKIINKNYVTQDVENQILAKTSAIIENLEQHRTQNVIGQMLLHQSMASTKYMSKWIEEKNKA